MPNLPSLTVNKLNQRGVAHLLMLLILAGGLIAGVYLVSSPNSLKLFSKASVSTPISSPISRADLTPTNLKAPSSAKTGQEIPVSWGVKNQGTKEAMYAPTTSAWEDRVYLSTDSNYDSSDTYLGKSRQTNPVPAGGGYAITPINIPIPNRVVNGNYYLILRVDNYNDVAESDNNNNQKVVPITLSSSAPSSKRVFVTSTTYNGNLGGLSGADAKCQERAVTANLGGTWKAWITTNSSVDVASRFNHSTVPYKLVSGAQVADNWTDLTTHTLQGPINITEKGEVIPITGNHNIWNVWTNTTTSGHIYDTQSSLTCSDWTSEVSSQTGRGGSSEETNYRWTASEFAGHGCNTTARLYCFEQ